MSLLPQDLKDLIGHEIPRMDGWSDEERCWEMAELVVATKPEVIVEIGTFAGRATVAMGLALQHNQRGTIYGIDPWKKECTIDAGNPVDAGWWANNVDLHAMHRQAVENVWRFGLDDYCVLIRTTSKVAVRLFSEESVDILLIDGNHSEESSSTDARLWLPTIRPGGFIWADDCDWHDASGHPSTQKAQRLILAECDEMPTRKDDGKFKLFRKR